MPGSLHARASLSHALLSKHRPLLLSRHQGPGATIVCSGSTEWDWVNSTSKVSQDVVTMRSGRQRKTLTDHLLQDKAVTIILLHAVQIGRPFLLAAQAKGNDAPGQPYERKMSTFQTVRLRFPQFRRSPPWYLPPTQNATRLPKVTNSNVDVRSRSFTLLCSSERIIASIQYPASCRTS